MVLRRESIRVFISSTFRDMHAERDHLTRFVFPELRVRCLKRAVEFVGVDLRWGVTEEEARERGALAVCLEEIELCRPFFVCLLGDRFGWVPPPEEIERGVFDGVRNDPGLDAAETQLIDDCYVLDETSDPPLYRLRRDQRIPDEAAESLAGFWEREGLPLAGESITAREILRGVFEAGYPSTHALFYLRKSGVHRHPAFPSSFLPVFVERSPERRFKLARLKRRIRGARDDMVVRTYRARYAGMRIDPTFLPATLSPADHEHLRDGVVGPLEVSRLGEQLAAALHEHGTVALDGLEEFGERVLEDLWTAIRTELERVPEAQLDEHERERAYHERFLEDRTRLFIGREDLLEKMQAYAADSDDRGALAITGEPGSGKSALLAECARRCRERYPEALVVPHFIGAAPDSTNVYATIRSICEELRRGCELEEEVSHSPETLRVQLRSFLAQAGAVRPVVLTLDAINQLDPAGRSHELGWFPFSVPAGTRVIVSALAGTCLDRLRERLPESRMIDVPALPPDARGELIERHLARRRKKLTPQQVARLMDTNVRPHAGHPLYLLVALEELCLFGEFGALDERLDRLPPTLPGLFAQLLARLEHDHGREATESISVWLAASRSGLLESEILDLLAGRYPGFPSARWVRFYRALELYLRPAEEETGAGTLDFYHDQLRFAVFRRYLGMESPEVEPTEALRAANRELAAYFRSSACEEDEPARWRTDRPRGLSELPYHQQQGEMWPALARTLCDLLFIEAKCSAGMLLGLQNDYSSALAAWPGHWHYDPFSHPVGPVPDWARDCVDALLGGRPDPHPKEGAGPVLAALQRLPDADRTVEVTESLYREERIPEEFFPPDQGATSALEQMRRTEEASDGKENRPRPDNTPEGIQAFANFLSDHAEWLRSQPSETVPMARNWAEGGEVVEATTQLATRLDRPWIARDPRPPVPPSHRARLWTITASADRLALTPDGKTAVCVNQKALDVWDVRSARLLHRLTGHAGKVKDIALTRDGTTAVTVSEDETLRIWDLISGLSLRTIETSVSGTVVALTWDGRLAAVGGSDGSLRVWDLDSGACIRTLTCDPSHDEGEDVRIPTLAAEIKGVDMTGDGRLLASFGAAKTLRIWSVTTGECLREFVQADRKDGTGFMYFDEPAGSRVALSSDGALVYVGGALWHLVKGDCLRRIAFHGEQVADVALTPDLRIAVSASGGSHRWSGERHWYAPNVLHVHDTASGASVRTFEKVTTSPSRAHGGLRRVALTWDGALSVSAGRDLRVWDLAGGVEERELAREGLGDIALSPDGRTIVSSADNVLEVSDTSGGRQSSLRSHDDAITSLAVSGDGGTCLSASCDGTVGLWDLGSRLCLRTLKGHSGHVTSVTFTSDGRTAVSGGEDGAAIVWDLVVGRPVKQIGGRAGVMSCIVALTPDNRFALTSASDTCELHLLDLRSGTRVRTFEGHADLVTNVVICPDGRTGVSASVDGTLRVWDLRSGECLRALEGHSARVAGVRLTPDGRTAISASDDRTVRVWSLASGECVACYIAYSEVCAVSEVAADGRFYCLTHDHQRHCLRLKNLGQEPPVVTAVRMFRFQSVQPEWIAALAVTRRYGDVPTETVVQGRSAFPEGPIPGCYDSDITAGCAWCGERFAPGGEVIQAAELNVSCLDLPSEAWDRPNLISECPHCQKPVRFNPFTVDRGCYSPDRSPLPGVGYLSRPVFRTLEGHSDRIKAVKLAGDGRRLVSAGVDSTLRVWDVESGECLHTLEGLSGAVWAVDVSRNGKLAASGGEDGAVRVWDIERGEPLKVLEGHGECVSSLALSPDGGRAVSSSWDGTVRVWDVANGRCLHTLQGNAGQVLAVALSVEKGIVVSGGEDGNIRVWDLESGECLQEIENEDLMTIAIDLAKDGRIAALGCMDYAGIHTVQVWDLAESRLLNSFGSDNLGPNSVRVTEDGRWLVVADGISVRVRDLERMEHRQRFEGAGFPNHSVVTVTPDASRIASGGDDHKVRVWEVGRPEPLQLLKDDSHFANVASLVGNGRRVITGGLDGSLRVWSLDSGECLGKHEAHSAAVYALAASADGCLAVTGSLDGSLVIWDLERGARLHDLRGHEKSLTVVALTPDGRRAVSAGWVGTVRVWDVGSGWCVGTLEARESPVDALALTPDGRFAVSTGQFEYGGELRVWDLESGECRQVIQSQESAIAVTPDGRVAVTGDAAGKFKVWDLAEGECLDEVYGHSGAVHALAVTGDGKRIVSAGWDHKVKVWDGEECLVEYPIPEGLQVLVLRDDLLVARDAAGAVLVYGTVDPTNRPLPFVTPVRIFDFHRRTWDGDVTALCKDCGKRFVVVQAMIDTIGEIGHSANLSEAESPCLKLPAEAWEDQRLRSRCPHCRRPLAISPFVVDNRDRH